jgi:hypothetical protein
MPADFQPAGEIKKRMALGTKIDTGSHEGAKKRTRLKLADGLARLKPENRSLASGSEMRGLCWSSSFSLRMERGQAKA